jgi:hypothetical protein
MSALFCMISCFAVNKLYALATRAPAYLYVTSLGSGWGWGGGKIIEIWLTCLAHSLSHGCFKFTCSLINDYRLHSTEMYLHPLRNSPLQPMFSSNGSASKIRGVWNSKS